MHDEIWKPIDWINPTYEISSYGRIRNIVTDNIRATRIVDGYVLTSLTIRGTDKKFNVRVHRLVAEAFLRTEDNKDLIIVNHLDSNRSNNHVSNLEWTTNKDNVLHMHSSGRAVNRETYTRTSLEEKGLIKRLYEQGMSAKSIGNLLSRPTSTIGRVLGSSV